MTFEPVSWLPVKPVTVAGAALELNQLPMPLRLREGAQGQKV
jgi:hypothetical protein